jgi:hypothetical protein
MDIYINPASQPVLTITGGTTKDTLIPPAERKVVFSGIDALFTFHKENFLPALEAATAPLRKPTAALQAEDADGSLSLKVAKAVGGTFVKHAAFMKMYSTYIKWVLASVTGLQGAQLIALFAPQ